MSFLSSLFGGETPGPARAASDVLADLCFKVRQEMGFLDDYLSNRTETAADLMRFHFSKDVLMILLSSVAVTNPRHDHQKLMQFNERVRSRYLSLLPVAATSLVGDCLICEDELAAIAPFVAPNAPYSQIRTTPVSTIGLISLVVDYRAAEFRNDVSTGMSQSKSGFGLFLPPARTFLCRVRGVPRDTISFDDVNYLAVAIHPAFHVLLAEIVGQ